MAGFSVEGVPGIDQLSGSRGCWLLLCYGVIGSTYVQGSDELRGLAKRDHQVGKRGRPCSPPGCTSWLGALSVSTGDWRGQLQVIVSSGLWFDGAGFRI